MVYFKKNGLACIKQKDIEPQQFETNGFLFQAITVEPMWILFITNKLLNVPEVCARFPCLSVGLQHLCISCKDRPQDDRIYSISNLANIETQGLQCLHS